MKYIYMSCQRSAFLCLIVMWLVAAASNQVYAQQKSGFESGVVRIKVNEALARQLENARMTKSAGNVLVTGIQSLDRVSLQYKTTGIKRVFRPAGKFEAKHRKYGLHRWYEVQFDKATPILSALQAYKGIEQIEFAQPLYKKAIIGSDRKDFGPKKLSAEQLATLSGAPNDPLFGQQWHYDNTGQANGTPGSDISLLQAWGIETGSSNVIVAVTDGGAQVDHPDLISNMWVNVDEVPGNGVDDDNNGYIDDINGYGFGDDTGEIAPDDHGTHTSGTVAATTNNGIGVAGVAGGSGAGDGVRIMSCAAFGAVGTGGFEDTYVYGADNGAVISQNSWGYTNPGVFDQAVLDAIDYFIAEAGKDELGNQVGPMRGGIVIFAAGNSDSNEQHYPGFYDATLAVSGVTNQDKKAWYSNFGEWVDLAAPGGETFVNNDPHGVLSTVIDGYGFFQGTSMACPHVSGVAALIVSKFGGPGLTPEMVRGRLTQLVDDIDTADPPFVGLLGSGRLNAFLALQENDGDAPDPINNLSASAVAITEITLNWTAPLDSGNGSASAYDIRYSTSPINESNFGSATVWPNPPAPKPAGSPESVTITGLLPGTVYYFAIKSADFFGNFSSVSNIVEQATNFAPVIAVSPATLVENLQTAETASQTFTISNDGLGVLNFTLLTPPGFATASPTSGTVAPDSSVDITVTFSAAGLLAGTYQQSIGIDHNDPLQDSVSVQLILNVTNNGLPIASVNPDTLDYGDVFETDSVSQLIYVHNAGSEPLAITSVTSDNTDFVPHFSDTVHVAPFATVAVRVTYTASSLGASSGTVTLTTNDPDNSTFFVGVTGNGVVAPDIIVSPESLSATLNTDKSETQTLSIENTGGSNLDFSIEVSSAAATARVATVKNVVVPSTPATSAKTSDQKASASATKYPNQIKLKSVGKSAVAAKVLIITPDDNVSDIAFVLNSFDDIQASTISADSLPLLNIAKLSQYDIVFTTNNTQWLGSGGIDPEAVGDLLADYVDGGGKVIVNQFAYSYDAWQMAGRFIDDGYGPFTPSTTDGVVTVELGNILSPGHPILDNVSSLIYSGYVQNVGLASGATALAEWDNGELFLAANGNVVALNLLPSLGNGDPLQWEGDLPTIYQNAVHYLQGGGSFVSVSPTAGTVTPGEQLDLEVTFSSSGLDAGVYTASIDITTNVPHHNLVQVPAELTVLGPEFTVSPDSLYDELERQQTSTHTLLLSNNGPDDHAFTVSVQGAGFSTSSVKIVKPGQSARRPAVDSAAKQKQQKSARKKNERDGIQALTNPSDVAGRVASKSAVEQSSTGLYTTDFEALALGDINGQDGWAGQWGNWTVEEENAFGGAQHFRGLADGFGFSASFSPSVPVGSEPKSSTTMKVNLQGTNVSWQITPQSPSAGFVVTRIGFEVDGSITALVSDGAGGGSFETIAASTPSGYFDFTIEADRTTAVFDVFINDTKIFTGQGFAGDIEEVVILSFMEEAGPTLDVDDFQIIDGVKESAPTFISASPLAGNLPSGSTAEITVTFTSGDLEFGLYSANINIDVDGYDLTVPAKLRVIGDEAIDVSPTVLQTIVDYKGDSTEYIHIANTGGKPLTYGLQVIGAGTDIAKIPSGSANKFAKIADKRVVDKKAKDDKASKPASAKSAKIELFAGTSLLSENFDGGTFPPSGWSTADIAGEGVAWGLAADVGEANYSGTGEAATISSDAFGPAEFDAVLITPAISTAGYKNIAVQYNANYANFANLDFLDLDIQVDGGAWTTVLSWNEDHGTFAGLPGEFVSISLASYLDDASSFRLRWHYYDPNTGDWDWYAQVDDVTVLGDARQWLTVDPAAGTIPVGESADIAATFDASDLDPGFYVAGILVSSNAVEDPLVGVVASLQVRAPAVIGVDPDSVYVVLPDELTTEETLTISNSGASALTYTITDAAIPTASGVVQTRRESTQKRTSRSEQTISLLDTKAIHSSLRKLAGAELYSTGFEEFATGDVDGQEGWAGQFGNWTIESFNPSEGAQHFSGLADGLGQSLAFSPEVAVGDDDVSTTSMKIDLDLGVTWQIIPQSPTAGLVNTRFQISADGSLSTLVQDSVGTIFYQDIPGTLPDGYFDLRIEIKASTLEMTIYVNDAPIFTGLAITGEIEQVVVFSLMEEAGPLLDIDNFLILDGPAEAPWLTVEPDAGTIPAGGSASISLLFDATDTEPGTYTKILNISSNDPATPNVSVPVTLVILPNLPPVLAGVSDTTVQELKSINLSFTATDADDSSVSLTVLNVPGFMTATSTGNGFANYKVSPLIGDAGSYEITVVAEDPRGGSTSESLVLTVIPYGVQNFSLTYYKTGVVVTNFEDTVTLDIADPDLENYTIQANTLPASVGSVRFTLDGAGANTDNSKPYAISNWLLPNLSGGDHPFTAQAFTKSNGTGQAGQVKWGTIKVINSAAITDFDITNPNGVKIADLVDGGVIDISQPAFKQINIVANTSINSVRSVKFSVNGPTARIDNRAPYALKGNANGSDTFWAPKVGSYTLTAIPYLRYYGWGPEGTPLTIHFQVVNGSIPTVANARFDESLYQEEEVQVVETTEQELSVYPVPVKDVVSIKLGGKVEGKVMLNIMNLQGQSMHAKEGTSDAFRDYSVSTVQLGLSSGFYIVQIQQANGKRIIRKFVKE